MTEFDLNYGESYLKRWGGIEFIHPHKIETIGDIFAICTKKKKESATRIPGRTTTQCSASRGRSILDIFRLARNYGIDITLPQIEMLVYETRFQDGIYRRKLFNHFRCYTIGKEVVHSQHYSHKYDDIVKYVNEHFNKIKEPAEKRELVK